MLDALRDGVKYSNGNRAIRHLGIPAITVPMGEMADKRMPVGITFAGKAYSDTDLLRCAWAYENATNRRTSPPLAPKLDSDIISLSPRPAVSIACELTSVMKLTVDTKKVHYRSTETLHFVDVELSGSAHCGSSSEIEVSVFSNHGDISVLTTENGKWRWRSTLERVVVVERYPVPGKIPRDQFMIVIFAKSHGCLSDGILLQID